MTALQSSPLPLRNRRDRKGRFHLFLGTGWRPVQLTPEEAEELSTALHEWAESTHGGYPPPPPPGWIGGSRAIARWRRAERATKALLIAGILVCVGLIGIVAYTHEVTTTLSFSYTVQGPSAQVWNVTPCRTTPLVMTGGGESWDCSVVLWNVALANNSIQGVSVSGAGLDMANPLPIVVLPLNFIPFTVVGHTPTFGGTQNVNITIIVGQ